MYLNLLRWLFVISFLYCIGMYTYTNMSAEGFIFLIEGIYLCISLIILKSLYTPIMNISDIYIHYINAQFELLYVYSNILKKLNLKISIIYKCFH